MINTSRFLLLALGFILSFTCLAGAAETNNFLPLLFGEQKTNYIKSNLFLKSLGFEDFVGEIENTLIENKGISQISKIALQKSQSDLKSFNAAREMSNLIYVLLKEEKNNLGHSVKIRLITAMIIQQLNFFPLLTNEPLPLDKIAKIKTLSIADGLDLRNKFTAFRATERFFDEKLYILKIYLALLKPAMADQKKWIDALDPLLTQALSDPYTLEKRQQNRLFGRALVVTLVKFLRETKNTVAETVLTATLRQHNLYLENYVSAYYVHDVGRGDLRGHSLQSGELALLYSHGQEAFFTSLVIQPQTSENEKVSKKFRLNNSVLDIYKFLDTKKYYSLLDKRDTFRPWSNSEKDIYADFWDRKYANGFSHVGIVQVRKDDTYNIKVAWIWDIYPEKNKIGSVRVLTPEGFSYPEKMLKIAFLAYDPEKLLASLKIQVQKRGVLKNIWEGYNSYFGAYEKGGSGPLIDLEKPYFWPTKVDSKLVHSWTSLPTDKAGNWYNEEVVPRIFSRIKKYLVSSEAKLFADGLVSAKDMLYCSQLISMAYLEEINLDLQNSPDSVWDILKYASESINAVLNVNIKHRLVSPNGLAWQHDIVKNIFTVYLNRDRVEQQRTNTNPTMAEDYTFQLKYIPEIQDIKLDDDSLLILREGAIQLDLES